MKPPSQDQFSALEVGIAAFNVACGFLVAVVLIHVVFGQTLLQQIFIWLAGSLAVGILARVWLRQKETRGHPVNFLLVAVAGFVALDVTV